MVCLQQALVVFLQQALIVCLHACDVLTVCIARLLIVPNYSHCKCPTTVGVGAALFFCWDIFKAARPVMQIANQNL